jgi:VWFA-related protein
MHTRFLISAALILGTWGSVSRAGAEQPAPTAAAARPSDAKASVFPARTDLVLLDVIVRDKKGKPVPDLAPEEIEVYEDGVRQTVKSFRRVSSVATASPIKLEVSPVPESAGRVPAIDTGKATGNRLVTLVFDRLSPNGRRLAEGAAMELVKTQMTTGTQVAVQRLAGGAISVQTYTSDPEVARQAIQRATAGVSCVDASQPASGSQGATDSGQVSATASGADSRPDTAAALRSKLQGLDSGSMGEQRLSQSLMVDTLHGLADLIERFRPEGGRKALVLFSEGMIVPPGLDHVFRSLISTANRANVSVYTMDVRGLDLISQLSAARSALEETGRISEGQRLAGTAGNPMTQRQIGQDDMMLTSLGSNAVGTLGELSNSTGGLLTTETNNFSKGVAQIGADLREYYEAAYVPSTAGDPGQFHKIDVRVTRKGTRVRSRSGYFTSMSPGSAGLAGTAASALSVLKAATLPHDVETLSGVFRFGRQENALEYVVRVEVPLSRLALSQDAGAGRFSGHLTILGLLRDNAGEVLDVFGREYPVAGPLGQLEETRAASVRFARRMRLAPGQYTIEWVARDAAGDKATAERRLLMVSPADAALSMSSLVVVSGVSAAGAADEASDPLRAGDSVILPNLGQPIVPAPGRETLALYCIVYDKEGTKELPTATVELSRGAAVLARGTGSLPQADAHGRIQYLSTIPLRNLPPGEYRVRLSVSKGQATAEETAALRIGS